MEHETKEQEQRRHEWMRRVNGVRTFIFRALDNMNLAYDADGQERVRTVSGRGLALNLATMSWDRDVPNAKFLRTLISNLGDLAVNGSDELITEIEEYNSVVREAERCGKPVIPAISSYEQSKLVNKTND